MFHLILWLLLFALNSNLLILTLIFSLLVFNGIIFIELEELLDAWAFTHWWWQIAKRVAEEKWIASIMQNILSYHLRQIIFFVTTSLHIHQVFSIHILLHSMYISPAHKFNSLRYPNCFQRRLQAFCINLLRRRILCWGAWNRHFEFRRQVMCIDKIKDDIFELRETPADFKASIVVEWGQLRYKALDALMDLSWFYTV